MVQTATEYHILNIYLWLLTHVHNCLISQFSLLKQLPLGLFLVMLILFWCVFYAVMGHPCQPQNGPYFLSKR